MALWKWVLLPLMAAVILMCYLWAPDLPGFPGDSVTPRIIFWHVPMAILSMVWFWVATFYAIRLLRKGQSFDDVRATRAAEMGLLLTILATVTGAVFAKMQWGQGFSSPWYYGWWQWDPQQTAIVVVILIFFAYFGLRMSIDDAATRARVSAVYLILAGVAVPFLYYVLPRLPALGILNHPTGAVIASPTGMSPQYRVTFWLSVLAFFGTTLWAYQLQVMAARVLQAAGTLREATEPVVRAVRRGETSGSVGTLGDA